MNVVCNICKHKYNKEDTYPCCECVGNDKFTYNSYTRPDEFEEQMKNIASHADDDEENTHILMDDLMCDILCSLGYKGGVDIFKSTKKWYA